MTSTIERQPFVRAYLRASSEGQDARRPEKDLDAFAAQHSLVIASRYIENESGASLKRPELMRLLNDAHPGDILLVEQVDRLNRLNTADWEALKARIAERRIKIVALDLPTSHMLLHWTKEDFAARMFEAVNGMLLDMLAAVARKDYEDRRRRTQQGIDKHKSDKTKYRGRRADTQRNAGIIAALKKETAWTDIQRAAKCSRSTVARLAKELRANENASATAD